MSEGNVRVVCRFRPLNEKEKQMEGSICARFPDSQTAELEGTNGPMKFLFDKVFTPNATQQDIYMDSGRVIANAITDGFNGTVFAYGQTSSGKTFTMTGPDIDNPAQMGIIPRMVSDIFQHIQESDETTEYTVKVAYTEIYLEKIRDLLEPTKCNLKIHEDRTRGVYIADLTEVYVTSQQEVSDLMKKGTSNREVAYTHMNAGSSRSHAIFVLTLSQTNTLDYSAKSGKLYLVDLAGSEKVGKTGAEGMRLEEAKKINVSLTNLGLVIFSLTDGKSSHVPYRNSKLTRILQDSLGGNSKTCLIVTCSPSPFNHAETLSTLRFGVRAKAIKNKPKVNKEYTVAELKLMLANAKEEIEKRDRAIRKLEKLLKDNNLAIDDASEEVPEEEPPQNTEAYNEVILELEETRNRLSDEVYAHKLIKDQHQDLLREHTCLNEEFQNLYQVCNMQKEAIEKLKDSNNEAEEMLEQLRNTKESLLSELNTLSDNKLHLEALNTEQKVEIEELQVQLQLYKNDVLLLSKRSNELSFSNIEDLEIHADKSIHKVDRHTKSVDISNFLVSPSQDIEILAMKHDAMDPYPSRGLVSCSYTNIGNLISRDEMNDESASEDFDESLVLEKQAEEPAKRSISVGESSLDNEYSEIKQNLSVHRTSVEVSSIQNELIKENPVERKVSIGENLDFEKESIDKTVTDNEADLKEMKDNASERESVRVMSVDSADFLKESEEVPHKSLTITKIEGIGEDPLSFKPYAHKQIQKPETVKETQKVEHKHYQTFSHRPQHQEIPSKTEKIDQKPGRKEIEITKTTNNLSLKPEKKDEKPTQNENSSKHQDKKQIKSDMPKKQENTNRFYEKYKKLKELYMIALERLSEGDISIVKKNDMLQRNLEQLTLMYYQLSSQISVLKVDKTVNEKKIGRLTDKNKKMEEHVKNLEIKLEEAETREVEAGEENERRMSMFVPTNSSGAVLFAKNIKRTIKGGKQSFAFKDILKGTTVTPSIRNR